MEDGDGEPSYCNYLDEASDGLAQNDIAASGEEATIDVNEGSLSDEEGDDSLGDEEDEEDSEDEYDQSGSEADHSEESASMESRVSDANDGNIIKNTSSGSELSRSTSFSDEKTSQVSAISSTGSREFSSEERAIGSDGEEEDEEDKENVEGVNISDGTSTPSQIGYQDESSDLSERSDGLSDENLSGADSNEASDAGSTEEHDAEVNVEYTPSKEACEEGDDSAEEEEHVLNNSISETSSVLSFPSLATSRADTPHVFTAPIIEMPSVSTATIVCSNTLSIDFNTTFDASFGTLACGQSQWGFDGTVVTAPSTEDGSYLLSDTEVSLDHTEGLGSVIESSNLGQITGKENNEPNAERVVEEVEVEDEVGSDNKHAEPAGGEDEKRKEENCKSDQANEEEIDILAERDNKEGRKEEQMLIPNRQDSPTIDIYDLYGVEKRDGQESPLPPAKTNDQPLGEIISEEKPAIHETVEISIEESLNTIPMSLKRHSLPSVNQMSWLKKLIPHSWIRSSAPTKSQSAEEVFINECVSASPRQSFDENRSLDPRESVNTMVTDGDAGSQTSSTFELDRLESTELSKDLPSQLCAEETLMDLRISVSESRVANGSGVLEGERTASQKAIIRLGVSTDLHVAGASELEVSASSNDVSLQSGEILRDDDSATITPKNFVSKDSSNSISSANEFFCTPEIQSQESRSSFYSLEDMILAYSTDELRQIPGRVTKIEKKANHKSDSIVNLRATRLPGLSSRKFGSSGRLPIRSQKVDALASKEVLRLGFKLQNDNDVGRKRVVLPSNVMNALQLGRVVSDANCTEQKDASEFKDTTITHTNGEPANTENISSAPISVFTTIIRNSEETINRATAVDTKLLSDTYSQIEDIEKDMDQIFLPTLKSLYKHATEKDLENRRLNEEIERLKGKIEDFCRINNFALGFKVPSDDEKVDMIKEIAALCEDKHRLEKEFERITALRDEKATLEKEVTRITSLRDGNLGLEKDLAVLKGENVRLEKEVAEIPALRDDNARLEKIVAEIDSLRVVNTKLEQEVLARQFERDTLEREKGKIILQAAEDIEEVKRKASLEYAEKLQEKQRCLDYVTQELEISRSEQQDTQTQILELKNQMSLSEEHHAAILVAADEKRNLLEETVKSLQTTNEDIQSLLNQKEEEMENIRQTLKELKEEAATKSRDYKEILNARDLEIASFTNHVTAVATLTSEKAALQALVEEKDHELKALHLDIEEKTTILTSDLQSVIEKSALLETINADLTVKLQASESLSFTIHQTFEDETRSFQSQITSLTHEIERLSGIASENDKLKDALREAREKTGESKAESAELRAVLTGLEEKNGNLEVEVRRLHGAVTAMKEMRQGISQDEINAVNEAVAELQGQCGLDNSNESSAKEHVSMTEGEFKEELISEVSSTNASRRDLNLSCQSLPLSTSHSMHPNAPADEFHTPTLHPATSEELALSPNLPTATEKENPVWLIEENSELWDRLKEVETALTAVDMERSAAETEAWKVFSAFEEERDLLVVALEDVKERLRVPVERSRMLTAPTGDRRERLSVKARSASETVQRRKEDDKNVIELAEDDDEHVPLSFTIKPSYGNHPSPSHQKSDTTRIQILEETIYDLKKSLAAITTSLELPTLSSRFQESDYTSTTLLYQDRLQLLLNRYETHRIKSRETESRMTARIYELEAELQRFQDEVCWAKLRCDAVEAERDAERVGARKLREDLAASLSQVYRVSGVVDLMAGEKKGLEARIETMRDRLEQYEGVIRDARETIAKLQGDVYLKEDELRHSNERLIKIQKKAEILAMSLKNERAQAEEMLKTIEENEGAIVEKIKEIESLKSLNTTAQSTIMALNAKHEQMVRHQTFEFEKKVAQVLEESKESVREKEKAIEELEAEKSYTHQITRQLEKALESVSSSGSQISILEETLQARCEELDVLRLSIDQKTERILELQASHPTRDDTKKLETFALELSNECERLKSTESQMALELDAKRCRVQTLEHEVEHLKTDNEEKVKEIFSLSLIIDQLETLANTESQGKSKALEELESLRNDMEEVQKSRDQLIQLQQSYENRIQELEEALDNKPLIPPKGSSPSSHTDSDLAIVKQRCTELESALSKSENSLTALTTVKLKVEAELARRIEAEKLLAEENRELERELSRVRESYAVAERELEEVLADRSTDREKNNKEFRRESGDLMAPNIISQDGGLTESPEMMSSLASSPKTSRRAHRGFSIGPWILNPKGSRALALGFAESPRRSIIKQSSTTGNLYGADGGLAGTVPVPLSGQSQTNVLKEDREKIIQLENLVLKLEEASRHSSNDASIAFECLTSIAIFLGVSETSMTGHSSSKHRAEVITDSIIQVLKSQRGRMLELDTLLKERDGFITEILHAGRKMWEEKQESAGEVGRMEVLVKRLQSVIEDSASVVGRRKLHRLVTSTLKGNRSQSGSE
ncbi:hypothetical protein HDU67_005691 [Dinochytrium kinnereticum]|nr:hypothetical protein HDU67_005691 [Dinochytrium kinnereticum]